MTSERAAHSCGCRHEGPCRESNCGHHEWQDHNAALAATPAPREDGWEELRREIEALPEASMAVSSGRTPARLVGHISRPAVLAIVDRLAAARGEPPEPGLDVERLARAIDAVEWANEYEARQFAENIAAEYAALATPTTPEPDQ